jgi:carbamoyltransferase
MDGNIIGFAKGRAEFGPRALGNRSILANPMVKENKKRLNDIIKKREWFRPFAPMVIKEKAGIYFKNCQESPHMLLVFDLMDEYREKLPAITHVDGTARVQTIDKEDNAYIYGIIEEFEKLSGIPVILNTSFNGPGKPLVNTFHDALKTFLETDLDFLVVEDYLISKKRDRILKDEIL